MARLVTSFTDRLVGKVWQSLITLLILSVTIVTLIVTSTQLAANTNCEILTLGRVDCGSCLGVPIATTRQRLSYGSHPSGPDAWTPRAAHPKQL